MGTRDDYVEAIKSSFVTLGTKAAFTALVVEAPWMNLPIVRSIIQFIIEKILKIVATQGETAAFFLYIDTRVNDQANEFELASYANREAQTNGTKEQKDAAEKLLVEKFSNFVRLSS